MNGMQKGLQNYFCFAFSDDLSLVFTIISGYLVWWRLNTGRCLHYFRPAESYNLSLLSSDIRVCLLKTVWPNQTAVFFSCDTGQHVGCLFLLWHWLACIMTSSLVTLLTVSVKVWCKHTRAFQHDIRWCWTVLQISTWHSLMLDCAADFNMTFVDVGLCYRFQHDICWCWTVLQIST